MGTGWKTQRGVIGMLALMAAGLTACGGAATPAATAVPTEAVMTEAAATPAVTEMATEAATPAMTEAATQASASGPRTVTAGSTFATFAPYTVSVLDGWADTNQVAAGVVDTLLLTKGEYTLMISQVVGGGGECHFGGETVAEGQSFPQGILIVGTASQFMRGSGDGQNWTVCEKGPDTFGFPTTYGYITYKTPAPVDPATLSQLDAMVASLASK